MKISLLNESGCQLKPFLDFAFCFKKLLYFVSRGLFIQHFKVMALSQTKFFIMMAKKSTAPFRQYIGEKKKPQSTKYWMPRVQNDWIKDNHCLQLVLHKVLRITSECHINLGVDSGIHQGPNMYHFVPQCPFGFHQVQYFVFFRELLQSRPQVIQIFLFCIFLFVFLFLKNMERTAFRSRTNNKTKWAKELETKRFSNCINNDEKNKMPKSFLISSERTCLKVVLQGRWNKCWLEKIIGGGKKIFQRILVT